MGVKFEDYSVHVKSELDDAIIAYLYEAAGEVEAQTKRNTRAIKYGRYDVKNSWKYAVDENKGVAQVGSPLEQAFWEELGTGEYALNGDGRKGWWVYVDGNDTPSRNQKEYTYEEALQVLAMLKSDGLDAHMTKGTRANRPLHNAFTSLKSALIRQAEKVIGGRMGE